MTKQRAHNGMRASLTGLALLSLLSAAPATAAPDDSCGVPPGANRCESWVSRYSNTADSGDSGVDVAMSSDGTRAFVGGYTASPEGGFDFATLAIDTGTGTQRWVERYDGPGHGTDQISAVALSPDGATLFVTGWSVGSGSGEDYATIAYDATTGEQVWLARYDGPVSGVDHATSIDVSDDGSRVFVGGWSDTHFVGLGDRDSATIAYDATTGEQVWADRYDGPAAFWDIALSLDAGTVPTPTGPQEMVFFTSRTNVGGTGNNQTDIATVAYDGVTGERMWVTIHDGQAGGRDYPYAVQLSPDGETLYVIGEASRNLLDYITIAYDPVNGAKRWVTYYDGGFGDDRPLGLAVSPDNERIYVTGFGPNQNGIQGAVDRSVATVAYDADGAQVWASRHTDAGGEAAGSLAISRDGRRIYAIGLSVGQSFGVNGIGPTVNALLTIAYDTSNGTIDWIGKYSDPGSARAAVVSPDAQHVYVTGGGTDLLTLAYETGAPDITIATPTVTIEQDPITSASQDAVRVSGDAESGATVDVTLSDGTTTITGSVVATFDRYASTLDASTLEDGTITARVIATDTGGNVSAPVTDTALKDTISVQPTVTVNPGVINAADQRSVTIEGTAEEGASVAITVTDGFDEIAATAPAPAGTYGATIDATELADGALTARAVATDAVGNVSIAATATATKDATPPEAPDVIAPAQGSYLQSAVSITGTGEPQALIRVFDGDVSIGSTSADATGSWALANEFGSGSHTLTATATDAAGNVSGASAPRGFSVDSSPPDAPTFTTPAEAATLTDSFVTLSGTAEPRAIVTVREGARIIATVHADAAGEWSAAAGFTNGAHTIAAAAVDAAGQAGPASARTFTVADTTAPLAAVITTPTQSSTLHSSLVTVSGTSEPGGRIDLREGSTLLGTAATNTLGAWHFALAEVAPGAHTITAIARDAAGNTAPTSSARTFTVQLDDDRPVLMITSPEQGDVRPGTSLFTGSGAPSGAWVSVFEGGNRLGVATAGSDGTWVLSVRLPDGSHRIVATSPGASPSQAVTFTVDAELPTVSIATPQRALFGPGDDTLLQGQAFDNLGVVAVTVSYFDAFGRPAGTEVATCACAPDARTVSWTVQPTFPSGYYEAVARGTDQVGNVSLTSSTTFIKI
jgi:hypothetical protein